MRRIVPRCVLPASLLAVARHRSQCLVELSAALEGRKPVVMLIGAADADGRFVPESGMGNNLILSIDVQQAEASVPADREPGEHAAGERRREPGAAAGVLLPVGPDGVVTR